MIVIVITKVVNLKKKIKEQNEKEKQQE